MVKRERENDEEKDEYTGQKSGEKGYNMFSIPKEGRNKPRSPWQHASYYGMYVITRTRHSSQLLLFFSLASRGQQSFPAEAPAASALH